MNSHVNQTLKTTPFHALTGRHISLAISLASPNPINYPNLPLQELFNKVFHSIFLSKNKSIKVRSRPYTNRHRQFNVGDLVWLYISPVRKTDKTWNGPYSIVNPVGNACYVIQPVLIAGRELLVHVSRLKKCTSDIGDIKKHLGVKSPNNEQEIDLFSDLETIEGFNLEDVIYDDMDDIHDSQNTELNISAGEVVPPSTEEGESTLSDEEVPSPTYEEEGTNTSSADSSLPSDQLSQELITSHQHLVENNLHLTPSSNNNNDEKQPEPVSDEIIPGVNAPLPIILKKGQTKKPIREKFSLLQTMSSQVTTDPKNTLYFRGQTQLEPFQEAEVLLTCSELPNLSNAKFI